VKSADANSCKDGASIVKKNPVSDFQHRTKFSIAVTKQLILDIQTYKTDKAGKTSSKCPFFIPHWPWYSFIADTNTPLQSHQTTDYYHTQSNVCMYFVKLYNTKTFSNKVVDFYELYISYMYQCSCTMSHCQENW
jgi:hypothetical protein